MLFYITLLSILFSSAAAAVGDAAVADGSVADGSAAAELGAAGAVTSTTTYTMTGSYDYDAVVSLQDDLTNAMASYVSVDPSAVAFEVRTYSTNPSAPNQVEMKWTVTGTTQIVQLIQNPTTFSAGFTTYLTQIPAISSALSLSSEVSATLVDYDPCAGRSCGDVCNNCQLGEPCPSVVNYCDPNGACVPNNDFECLVVPETSSAAATDAPAPVPQNTRHPLVRVQCGMQSQAMCYGLSADLSAEYDGVCGWSAQQRRCVVVSIGEESKEGAMCHMHRTIAACNGGSMMGFGTQFVPPMAMMEGGEGIDNVCAWNPFTNTCKDGQLENEAGDSAGFGMAGFGVCNGATNALSCPAPFCFWNQASGACVPGLNPELQKTNEHKSASNDKNDFYLLTGIAGGAFLFGLGLTFLASRWCMTKSSYQEPLHLSTV